MEGSGGGGGGGGPLVAAVMMNAILGDTDDKSCTSFTCITREETYSARVCVSIVR